MECCANVTPEFVHSLIDPEETVYRSNKPCGYCTAIGSVMDSWHEVNVFSTAPGTSSVWRQCVCRALASWLCVILCRSASACLSVCVVFCLFFVLFFL